MYRLFSTVTHCMNSTHTFDKDKSSSENLWSCRLDIIDSIDPVDTIDLLTLLSLLTFGSFDTVKPVTLLTLCTFWHC